MSIEQFVSVFSAATAFVGLLLVVFQLRASAQQQEISSLVEILDINRRLLSLGFSHPPLFAVLSDAKTADSQWERYYLQLWFNQYSLTHLCLSRSVFQEEFKTSIQGDLADFLAMKNAQKHWEHFKQYYPVSFQNYVDDTLKKIEPPVKAAHEKRK